MELISKIITVLPVIAGNGGKFIAANIAHTIKQDYPSRKVALVDFNLKHPYLGMAISEQSDLHGLDSIIEMLEYGHFTIETLLSNMTELKGGVQLLKGTKHLGRYKSFSGEHISAIISMLKSHYDYIVIAVSSEADNAGTVYGLLESNEVVLVAGNNLANGCRFPMIVDLAKNYKSEKSTIRVFYNRISEISHVDMGKSVQQFNLEVAGVCEYEPEAIDNLNLLVINKGLFKQRNKNQEMFSKYVKTIIG